MSSFITGSANFLRIQLRSEILHLAKFGICLISYLFYQIKVAGSSILSGCLVLTASEQCEPGLVFWLVEELLDSQTIDGCRSVFDYLDSRRERITAVSKVFLYSL